MQILIVIILILTASPVFAGTLAYTWQPIPGVGAIVPTNNGNCSVTGSISSTVQNGGYAGMPGQYYIYQQDSGASIQNGNSLQIYYSNYTNLTPGSVAATRYVIQIPCTPTSAASNYEPLSYSAYLKEITTGSGSSSVTASSFTNGASGSGSGSGSSISAAQFSNMSTKLQAVNQGVQNMYAYEMSFLYGLAGLMVGVLFWKIVIR